MPAGGGPGGRGGRSNVGDHPIAKLLHELANTHPLWVHPEDAELLGVSTGDLVRVSTEIGHFVIRAMATEGIRPGIVAASHHMGRWRLDPEQGMDRWSSALVDLREEEPGRWRIRQLEGIRPFESDDPDSRRVWWNDAGVHQNLTFPVQPDPISGMHCWHQRVRVERAHPEDAYGDVVVDTGRAHQVYLRWLEKTRHGPGPEGMRRPMWMFRPVKPHPDAFRLSPEG